MYSVLEGIFEKFVPLFSNVLSDLARDEKPDRIDSNHCYYGYQVSLVETFDDIS